MPDILSQGGDREPSPWPRRLVVIAVVVAVATVLILQHLPRHGPTPAAARHGSRASSGAPAAGRPDGPNGIVGQTVPWASGLRLPVTGQQPTWFYPATGRMRPIGGLLRDMASYVFTRMGGGWAVQADPPAEAGCGSCANVPLPVFFLAERARSVTQIGTANVVAPAATTGAVWLTTYQPGVDMRTAAGTAREVSAAGTPLRPPLKLPAGYAIDQATDRGLLLAPVSGRPGTVTDKLWNPAAPRASRSFAGVIAASAREIAWTPRCAPLCRMHLLNVVTGRHAVVSLRAGTSAAAGRFSPDGHFLALSVNSRSNGDNGALATQLEVASVATGRLTIVPRISVSSDALISFGWPAGGDKLVAELSFTTKVQVASWRPGAARLAVAIFRPGPYSTSLIVG